MTFLAASFNASCHMRNLIILFSCGIAIFSFVYWMQIRHPIHHFSVTWHAASGCISSWHFPSYFCLLETVHIWCGGDRYFLKRSHLVRTLARVTCILLITNNLQHQRNLIENKAQIHWRNANWIFSIFTYFFSLSKKNKLIFSDTHLPVSTSA